MNEISFSIPRIPVSLNRLLRLHWAKQKKYRDAWFEEIWAAIPNGKGMRKPGSEEKRQCYIEIHVVHPKRRYDDDNLAGACKVIVDCCRTLGLIYQDSPKWLTMVRRQSLVSRSGPPARTEVRITEKSLGG